MNIIIDNSKVAWELMGKHVKIEKNHIIEAKVVGNKELVLLLYEKENSSYPCLAGYNYDGSIRFEVCSRDDFGILRFSKQYGIEIPIVGWVKEDNEYTDYYFSLNPQNGELKRYGRAY